MQDRFAFSVLRSLDRKSSQTSSTYLIKNRQVRHAERGTRNSKPETG